MRVVDLFAGFGWSEGIAPLGIHDIGIEWNTDACQTRRNLGHLTVRSDLEQYPPEPFRGFDGLIASPPCQDFSVAGKQARRGGDRGRLIDLVPVWVETVRPEWVACEQVPPCLDIWREHAHRYRELGYSTWVGILNTADYGVPQTRRRAFLMASRVRPVVPPSPSHARDPQPSMFGTLEPWVTMADALGWGMAERPYFTLATAGGKRGGADEQVGGSGARKALYAEREHSWLNRRQQHDGTPVRSIDGNAEPAPTLTGIAGAKRQWIWERPSTTVAADPRITARCHHDEGSQGANAKTTSQVRECDYDGTEPIRLTIAEALILQGFRPDLPLAGSRTSQFLQIGNAVPPPMAQVIVSALTGIEAAVAA